MRQPLKLKYNAQAAVPNRQTTMVYDRSEVIETKIVFQDPIAANAQTKNWRNPQIISHSFGFNAQ